MTALGPGAAEAELIATHTAAKAFLIGMWAGAIVMVLSFTQLYLVGLGPVALDWRVSVAGGLLLLGLGGWMFWSNRVYYQRLEFPWKKRWETAATVVAGSGVIFWLLFALLVVLAAGGVRIV